MTLKNTNTLNKSLKNKHLSNNSDIIKFRCDFVVRHLQTSFVRLLFVPRFCWHRYCAIYWERMETYVCEMWRGLGEASTRSCPRVGRLGRFFFSHGKLLSGKGKRKRKTTTLITNLCFKFWFRSGNSHCNLFVRRLLV